MRCALVKRKTKASNPQTHSQSQQNSTHYFSTSHHHSSTSLNNNSTNNNNTNITKMGRQTRSTTDSTKTNPISSSSRQTRSFNNGKSTLLKTQKSTDILTVSSRPSGGGRHLQPPIGNDAKLKHKCPFDGCPWRFATPYKLRRHIKSHTKETPYQCKECGRGFSVRYNLLMHIQTIHSTPQKYTCPLKGCKEAFHTQSRLNGHLRKVHKTDMKQIQADKKNSTNTSTDTSTDPTSPVISGEEDASKNTNSLTCKDCGKSFTTQYKLNTHNKTVHNDDHHKPHKCTVENCHKSFQTADKLQKHKQTHSSSGTLKSWVCPYTDCKKVFMRQSYLKNHLKIHSKGQYVCPIPGCGHRLSSELEYNDHINLHMGYSLPCPQCSLIFPTPKRLELHCHVAHGTDVVIPPNTHHTGYYMSHLTPATPTTPLSIPSPFPPPLTTTAKDKASQQQHHVPNNTTNSTTSIKLPNLDVYDVEAVISQPKTIEQFFNPLGGNEGYESDSGYSTFDVSPHGSYTSSSNIFNGLLSPAITPITPTPATPTSMLTSPNLFNFSDEVLLGPSPSFFPAPPLSANSSCDGNFFFNSGHEIPPSESFTDSTTFSFNFPPPTHVAPPTHIAPPTSRKHELQEEEFPQAKRLQTVQKATRNNSTNIEESKQTVVFVPNSYMAPPTLTTPTNMYRSSVAVLTTPPPVRAEDSVMIRIKPELAYVNEPSCHGNSEVTPSPAPCKPNDSGRTVFAQIVAPISKTPPTSKGNGKSPGKTRQRSNQSAMKPKRGVVTSEPVVGGAKSTWPKSMNPGNLVAFRNFILKKLKKDQTEGEGEEEVNNYDKFASDVYGRTVGCDPDIPLDSLEDIFKDIDFNPDSLLSLSSRDSRSLSPLYSPPSDVSSTDPFSPSPYDNMGSFDGMDFDGFFQLYHSSSNSSSSPFSSSLNSEELLSNLIPLSRELDTIFKSDADPLLGALT